MKKTIVDVICGKTPTQHLNNGVNIYSSPEVHYLMKAAAWEAWKKCFETTITNVDHIPSETDFNVIIKPAFESWWEQELLEENK